MKIENRQRFLMILTGAMAALWLCDYAIFEPLINLWSARSKQITQLREQVKNGNALIKTEASWRRRWDDMRSNVLSTNSSQAELQLVAALDNWSRNSGAQISSVMPQWKNDSTNYMTLNCRVEATGALGSLSQFLYSLEKGPMALKLDSVELSAHDATGQQLTLGLQISGLSLLQPLAK